MTRKALITAALLLAPIAAYAQIANPTPPAERACADTEAELTGAWRHWRAQANAAQDNANALATNLTDLSGKLKDAQAEVDRLKTQLHDYMLAHPDTPPAHSTAPITTPMQITPAAPDTDAKP